LTPWLRYWPRERSDTNVKIVSVMTTASAGGAEFAAVEMLDALAERGHDVVMLSNQPDIGRQTRVRVQPLQIGPKLSRMTWRHLMRDWVPLTMRFRRELEQELPYDVLLVHYKKEQLMAACLPDRLRATLVWAEWGPVPFPLRKGIPRQAYLVAARRARLIMAVSPGTKASVEAVGVPSWKVVVVPNVVDTDAIRYTAIGRTRVREQLRIPDDAFVVGCISRFHPKKRNDVVVEAVTRLENGHAHLILAGAGETEHALREQARSLEDRVHFIPTPTDDVADVLSAFDVSVFCPSPTEGAPRATILGMLASRPCLATGPEGVGDIIRPEFGAIASPTNDATALEALLRTYMQDANLGERQGEAARAWAEATYARPVVASLIESLFAQARRVGSRPRG
jgi:glycosyltransferase involved in cell wall biosynthesis